MMLGLVFDANLPMMIIIIVLAVGALVSLFAALHYGRRLSATVKGVSFELDARREAAKEAISHVEQVIESKVGTPNGEGNVTAMLEKVLRGQRSQDVQLNLIEGLVSAHALRLSAGAEAFVRLEKRLDDVERIRQTRPVHITEENQ